MARPASKKFLKALAEAREKDRRLEQSERQVSAEVERRKPLEKAKNEFYRQALDRLAK